MKTRNGFVSNSSSSSYIIAFDMDLNELKNNFVPGSFSGDQTSIEAFGIDSVIAMLKHWYGISVEEKDIFYWGTEEEMDEYYKDQFIKFSGLMSRVDRALHDRKNIAIIDISYGDNTSEENLRSGKFTIIERYG